MTVAALPRSIDYAEDGVTVAFAVPWKFNAPEDVKALRTSAAGVETELTYGADYSVTGGATDAGGELTVTAAAAAGVTLSIWSETGRAQTDDYEINGTFPAETTEDEIDRLSMVDQEQDAELARRPRFPRGATPVDFADLTGMQDGEILEFRDGKLARFNPAAFAGKLYAGAAGTGVFIPAVLTDPAGLDTLAMLALATGGAAIGVEDEGNAQAALNDRLRSVPSPADLAALPAAHTVAIARSTGRVFQLEDEVESLTSADTENRLFVASSAQAGKMWALPKRDPNFYDFGLLGDNATDNADSFNDMMAKLKAMEIARIEARAGTYLFSKQIDLNDDTEIIGGGRLQTILRCTAAAGTMINWIGSNDGSGDADGDSLLSEARKRGGLRELTLDASTAGNSLIGIETAYLIRAFSALENVSLRGFGKYGLSIGRDTFDIDMRNVEIEQCGNNAAFNGSGLFCPSGIPDLAAIRASGLKIEACGSVSSTGGGILWADGPTTTTANLILDKLRIQGNIGSYEAYFDGVNDLALTSDYGEGQGVGYAQNQFYFKDSKVRLGGYFGGSGTGYIVSLENAELSIPAHLTATDQYAAGDIHLDATSVLHRPAEEHFELPLRLVIEAGAKVMPDRVVRGLFAGNAAPPEAPAVDSGQFTINHSATGIYEATYARPFLSNGNRTVECWAETAGGVRLPAVARVADRSSTGCIIRVYSDFACTTLADAAKVELKVTGF